MSVEVAVLAATGTVGQKIIRMLEGHPTFKITQLAASEGSAGKTYGEAMQWREDAPLNPDLAKQVVIKCEDVTAPYALSALPSGAAREVEPLLASRGVHVISNASALRMDPLVPLIIPEINAHHLSLVERQETTGKIITNPNCSTVMLALGLAPLRELSKIKHVSVTTLQALSGAGYPGVPSIDLLGNVIPNIVAEEEKIQVEANKILGEVDTPLDFSISVQVNRVPVIHGHTISMHVEFEDAVTVAAAKDVYRSWNEKHGDLFVNYEDSFMPQPARVLTSTDQRIHLGRFQNGGTPNRLSLVSLGHNLVRGAAGAALLNLELAYKNWGKGN